MKQVAVVAVGGNALITDRDHRTVPDQYRAASATCEHIAAMIEHGYEVVITHGNGPQVGFILRRCELACPEMHMVPLDFIGADFPGLLSELTVHQLTNSMLGLSRYCRPTLARGRPATRTTSAVKS